MVFLVSSILIGLCIAVTTHLRRQNDKQISRIATLSDFYNTVDEMDSFARAYLSSGNAEDYTAYCQRLTCAQAHLEAVSAQSGSAVSNQLSFLRNMLDTYDERMQASLSIPQDWYTGYQVLQYTNQLIQGTISRYYEMLINDIRLQMAEAQQLWKNQLIIVVWLLTFLMSVSIGLSRYFLRKISAPIAEIVEAINSIQCGNYNISTMESGPEEILILSTAVSEMASILKNNMELLKYNAELDKQLLEQENENLRIKNLLYISELNNLQAQINPHFLFNTLNMIAQRAMLSGDGETSKLMENTSLLLRYSLDKSTKISTLNEELSCIESYFYIQQQRFEGRVSFQLDIESGIRNIPMPAMILQPIVENSIIHGIKNMTRNAEVCLKAHCHEGNLHIHIEDNGQGIPSEKLEELQASFEAENPVIDDSEKAHIGLKNVYRRMKMYYGSEMKLYIESEEGCGTVVTIEVLLGSGGTV